MRYALFCILLLLSILGIPCAQAATTPTTQPATRPTGAAIPPAEFASFIGQPKHVLLDVRTPEEYAAGHLAGATLIDYQSPEFEQKISELPRDKTYLVYCRSGRRSKGACEQMQQLGFPNLVDLQGGIHAWQAAGQPTQTTKP